MVKNIVIIGIGNILCGDDGFGTHAIQYLYEKYDFPDNVQMVDGGTQGASLFRYIEQADKLLVFDAVDFDFCPGELTIRNNDELPIWLGAKKISAHQNSFSELLALASLKGVMPSRCILIGVQPASVEFGSKMSIPISSKIPEAINLALEILADWSIQPKPALTSRTLITAELMAGDFYISVNNELF